MKIEPISSGVAQAIIQQLKQPDPLPTEGLRIINAANGRTTKDNTKSD